MYKIMLLYLSAEELMPLKCGVGEDSWDSLGLQGDPTSLFWRRSTLGFLWKEWCWSWNSSTLATSCEELTHWKRLWCWEGLEAGGEGDNRGWDGWMASLTQWTWVWVNSGSWWWTGRPGMLQFTGSQRVGHGWATELNCTEYIDSINKYLSAQYKGLSRRTTWICNWITRISQNKVGGVQFYRHTEDKLCVVALLSILYLSTILLHIKSH